MSKAVHDVFFVSMLAEVRCEMEMCRGMSPNVPFHLQPNLERNLTRVGEEHCNDWDEMLHQDQVQRRDMMKRAVETEKAEVIEKIKAAMKKDME